jgi:hypothetical protein
MYRPQTSQLVILACAIAISFMSNCHAVAQIGGSRGEGERVAEDRPADENRAMISLSIWILKLSESHDEEADAELMAIIAARPVVGSVTEVREIVGQMREAGMLRGERELRMMTLDGQPVTAQIGRNQPRVVGVSTDPRRGQTSSLVMEPVGIKIKALPKIDSEDQIQVSLEIGQSDVEKSTDVTISITAEGGPRFADVVTTRQFNTTARTKNGSAVLLQRDAAIDSDDRSRDATELIILGAALVEEQD